MILVLTILKKKNGVRSRRNRNKFIRTDMKKKLKWAIALAPLMFVGCAEQIEVGPKASSGDDVLFMVENTSNGTTRTMYQDNWDDKNPQAVYWGNYLETTPEYINIYCPNTERGFAKYEVTPQKDADNKNTNVAATVAKVSDIGVQWGAENIDHTFYAFYPADKAKETLEGGNTIVATVDGDQSPQMYKQKETAETNFNTETFKKIGSFEDYNKEEYGSDGSSLKTKPSKTIYGMPDMSAAVMMAKTSMAGKYGDKVPLEFKVLADVLDLTFNGPVSPNSLGGNAGGTKVTRSQIKIQSVTIDVVTPGTGTTQKDIAEFPIDNTKSISGSFKLDMDAEQVTGITDGKPTVTLETSMGGGNPTLFVRTEIGDTDTPTATQIDHLRLRAFLIPGQIKGTDLNKLRIHIQTDCGDFYKMLVGDDTDITGKIYPVKLGYFKQRGQEFDLTRWIGQLDPNIYLSELSIPGAWHAANSAYQGNLGVDGLLVLYKAGVRAFEVHVKNGTDLRKAGDMETAFNFNTETENFKYPFTYSSNISYNLTNPSYGARESGTWYVNGTKYSYRRSVTATSVKKTSDITEYIVPKFWLRLFRYSGDTTTPMSTALEKLHGVMNSDGLIFLEVGEEGSSAISGVKYRSGKSYNQTLEKNDVTITGYQYSNSNYSWLTVYDFDMSGATETKADEKELPTGGTFSLTAREAWAIAVRSCFENLANKDIVYEGKLDRFTTINDVKGKIVTKINTNGFDDKGNSEASYLWGDNTPGLFSRWIDGSADTPLTINMKWKSPVEPYISRFSNELDPDENALRWCFSELDNIVGFGSSVKKRQQAIIEMNKIAATNYAGGLHRTFYETMIGGYTGGSWSGGTETTCLGAAKEFNPFVVNRLSDPTRQNVPLGLVFMNYAIPPTGGEDTYKSAELIQLIINNNKAFRLHRSTDGK